jgi:hypothetical protein
MFIRMRAASRSASWFTASLRMLRGYRISRDNYANAQRPTRPGREATLYAARSDVDLIFDANQLDEESIEAMLQTGTMLGPTLTHPRNTIDFTQPHDPAYQTTQRHGGRSAFHFDDAILAGVCDAQGSITPQTRSRPLFVHDGRVEILRQL